MTDDTQQHRAIGDDKNGRDMSRYSVTVHQASKFFSNAGIPRSVRTIQRYCKRGHLDCTLVDRETDETYFITHESIETRILELKQISNLGTSHGVADSRAQSRLGAIQRVEARQSPPYEFGGENRLNSEETDEVENQHSTEEVKRLRKEVLKLNDRLSLKDVEVRVKDKLLVTLSENRREDMKQIAELGQNVGEWKQKYIGLSAPNPKTDVYADNKTQFRDAEFTPSHDVNARQDNQAVESKSIPKEDNKNATDKKKKRWWQF